MNGDHGPGDGADAPRVSDPFEDGTLDVPNCPVCLTRMEAADSPNGGVFWECPECGQTRLA